MNDVVGDIAGVGDGGVLRRVVLVLGEVGHAGALPEGVGSGVVVAVAVVVVVVVSFGESHAEKHDAVVLSVGAGSGVVAVVAAL